MVPAHSATRWGEASPALARKTKMSVAASQLAGARRRNLLRRKASGDEAETEWAMTKPDSTKNISTPIQPK